MDPTASRTPAAQGAPRPWIDVLRVATIGLVVLYHADISVDGEAHGYSLFLSLVRMPLFFMLSGYLLAGRSAPRSPRAVLARDWRRLLVPYLLFGLATYPVWLAHALLHPEVDSGATHLWSPLAALAYGVDGPGRWLTHNPPIWFLPCLVLVHALHSVLAGWLPRSSTRLPASLVLGAVGLLWVNHESFVPPFSADIALVVLPFFALGHDLRTANGLEWVAARRWMAAALVLVAAPIVLACYEYAGHLDLNYRVAPSGLALYIGGCAGALGAVGVSMLVPFGRWLHWQSRQNLAVLCLHSSLLAIVHAVANRLVPGPVGQIDHWEIYPLIATIVSMVAAAGIGAWLEAGFPALFGARGAPVGGLQQVAGEAR